MPKITNNKATEKLECVFVDLTGPMKAISIGERRYAIIFVDDFTDMSWIRILKAKGDTTTALENFISEVATPAGLKISNITSDEGGEFKGDFKRKLNELKINHEMTPPGTPQYNGKAKRRLEGIKENTIVMLEGMTKGKSDKLWPEATCFSADMYNRCIPPSINISPFEKWHGVHPKIVDIKPFGTVGYMKDLRPKHKLAPRETRCIMLGLAHNRPSGSVRVRDRASGEVVVRLGVKWHDFKMETISGGTSKKSSASNDSNIEGGGPVPMKSPSVINIQ